MHRLSAPNKKRQGQWWGCHFQPLWIKFSLLW